MADPGQLEQVILNLAVNARDAMPDGGTLTYETRNVALDTAYAAGRPGVEPGDYVLLRVSDDGHGMDPETQARIFEPFFTTKELGKGTGLGLPTVYGIISQSGGHIDVFSQPGQGTKFEIYLPRHTEPASIPDGEDPPPPPRHGTETVLVVEDETMLRSLIYSVLHSCGYHVLVAEDGVEALRLLEQQPVRIDLLLTDVVMPRLGGRDLAERAAILQPHARVLFMSGYTDDAVVRHGVLVAETEFIQKPFSPAELTRRVRAVLDQP